MLEVRIKGKRGRRLGLRRCGGGADLQMRHWARWFVDCGGMKRAIREDFAIHCRGETPEFGLGFRYGGF